MDEADRLGGSVLGNAWPKGGSASIRTCIGCRRRDPWRSLLRIAVAGPEGSRVVVPDPGRRLPGRGAWLHPSVECFDLAVRRRAIGRALRIDASVGTEDVRAYMEDDLEAGLRTDGTQVSTQK